MKKLSKVISATMAVVLVAGSFAACSSKQPVTVASIDDLFAATVGVQLGTTGDTYVTGMEDADKNKKDDKTISRFKDAFATVQALTQGKIDAIVIDNEPAKKFVETQDNLKILEEPFADEDYAAVISKEKPELKEKINGALKELIADGTVDKIINNYTGTNTGSFQYTSPEGATYPNGKIVMATNATFPPYESIKGDKVVGIDADIALAIADKLGMSLEITNIDFDSIIPAITSGKADFAMAGMTVTEERLKNVDFTDSYCTSKQVVIVKK